MVTQRNIHEHAAPGSFKAEYKGFGIGGAPGAPVGGMQFGRMNAEMKSLVVEAGHGVPDNLVSEFTDGFIHQAIGFGQFDSSKLAGADGGCVRLRRLHMVVADGGYQRRTAES